MPLEPERRATVTRWIGYLLSAAFVLWLLLVVLPEVGDVEEAGELLADRVDAFDVALVVALLGVYLFTHGQTILTVVPGLGVGPAVWVRGVSGGFGRIAPAGWAIGAGVLGMMLRRRGVTAHRTGHVIAVTGVWNTLTKLSLPVFGLVAVAVVGLAVPLVEPWALLVTAAAAVAVAVGVVWLLLHEDVGRRLARIGQRPVVALAAAVQREPPENLPELVVAFQESTAEALRERPAAMAGWFYVHHLTQAALVWVGMLAVSGPGGLVVGWPEVLTAFSFGYLLTGLPFAPGGLGTLDVAVVAALTAAGEDPGVVTAGIAVYRIATYAVHIPLVAAWPVWRRISTPKPLRGA